MDSKKSEPAARRRRPWGRVSSVPAALLRAGPAVLVCFRRFPEPPRAAPLQLPCGLPTPQLLCTGLCRRQDPSLWGTLSFEASLTLAEQNLREPRGRSLPRPTGGAAHGAEGGERLCCPISGPPCLDHNPPVTWTLALPASASRTSLSAHHVAGPQGKFCNSPAVRQDLTPCLVAQRWTEPITLSCHLKPRLFFLAGESLHSRDT